MRSAGVLLIFLLVSAPAFPQESNQAAVLPSIALPPELDRILRDYEKEWQAHDAKALSELFAEDGFVLANGRPPVRGRVGIQAAYARSGGALSLRALAYATADTVGYIIGGYASTSASPDRGKFTLTLKREINGRWLIMSDMDNANQR